MKCFFCKGTGKLFAGKRWGGIECFVDCESCGGTGKVKGLDERSPEKFLEDEAKFEAQRFEWLMNHVGMTREDIDKRMVKEKEKKLLRVRFKVNKDDYRPNNWPVKYPYWCSGGNDEFAILISFADSLEYIKEHWPEVSYIDVEEVDEITFSDRFPKPYWYVQETTVSTPST